MDDKLFKILKKVYFKKKYVKDAKGYLHEIDCGDKFDYQTATTCYSTDNLTPNELTHLLESGYPTNKTIRLTHDDCIERYKTILQHGGISIEDCLTAYVCGFHSFPRGRQPILSYLFARAVPTHTFHGKGNCPVCSMPSIRWVQYGEELYRLYYSYAWNEGRAGYVIDLEEFSQLTSHDPTDEDIRIFRNVIHHIRTAPKGETPGKLEQRIRQAKIVPGYEKYRFRGQLMVLAELGIMPNPHLKPLYDGFTSFEERCRIGDMAGLNPRSDLILPLAGWSGDNPINEERLNRLFGKYL